MSDLTAAEYAALLDKKAQLKRELDSVTEELGKHEANMLSWFEENGTSSVTVGNKTLFLTRQLWASKAEDVDMTTAVKRLEAAGIGFVAARRINSQKLSAWVREQDRDGNPLPDELAEVLKVSEVFKVGHRTKNAA